jgi:hypothetical protein
VAIYKNLAIFTKNMQSAVVASSPNAEVIENTEKEGLEMNCLSEAGANYLHEMPLDVLYEA